MKANTLNKKSLTLEEIYKGIETSNEHGQYKHFIPHFMYVSDEVRLQLINDGFKVYIGAWGGYETDCLIIEW